MSSSIFEIEQSNFGVPESIFNGLSQKSKAAITRLLEQAPGAIDLFVYKSIFLSI